MSVPEPTLVTHAETAPDQDERLRRRGALADLAFGSAPDAPQDFTHGRHLALLGSDALDLDLSDPSQRQFGDYELIEKLGQGGMGVVYRARQRSLDREVALKLLSAGPWASRDFIERFRREAQSAARMQHPNIVAIHEIGAHDELNFFSMRLVRGPSLAAELSRQGRCAPRRAAELTRVLAEALHYAHRLGVLHLDLKPANVLIDESGQAQVADFGLARRLDDTLALDCDEVSGTPSYMAPEQAQLRRHPLSPATDIYGLGTILYELLCARPPFLGAIPQETLRRVVVDRPAPPSAFNPEVDRDLDAICLKCLEKDPALRYASARDLGDDLTRFLEHRETRARPLNHFARFWRLALREPRLSALAALLTLSLAVGFAATSIQWRRAEQFGGESRALLWESRREAAVRLEREGRGFDAVPRLIANLEEQERSGEGALAASERRRIGTLLGQGAVQIDRMVIGDANPLALELSPDGSLLAVALNNQTVRWYDSSTLAERGRVSLQDRLSSNGQRRAPRLLRFVGNERLRVTLDWYSNLASPAEGDTWLVDLEQAKVLDPPEDFDDFADAIYSDDGRHALLRNERRQVQLWRVDPWEARSKPGPDSNDFLPWVLGPGARYAATLTLTMGHVIIYDLPDWSRPRSIEMPGEAGVSAWGISGDGRWMALGDFDGRVFLLDPQTGALRLLPTPHSREVTWVAFSEDDAWVAAVTYDGTAYAFDVASGNPLIAGQMHQDFTPQRVSVNRAQRLLTVSGGGETALWRLPRPGPRAVPAIRIGAAPIRHAQAGDYAVGVSARTGLLASAGLDGQVRLWRLPYTVAPEAQSARQVPEHTWFDGRSLVDVAWDRVRVVSPDGAPRTSWLALPGPPGFAELVDGGRSLLVTVGPTLALYASDTLQARAAPIALESSPERLLTSGDGARAIVGNTEHGADGARERLRLYDVREGRRLAGEALLVAPLRRLGLSRDGTRVVAVGPAHGATTILSATDLSTLAEYRHDRAQPVLWADFAGDAAQPAGAPGASAGAAARDPALLLVSQSPDVRTGRDGLSIWDPANPVLRAHRPTGPARPIGVIASPAGPLVASDREELLDPGGGGGRTLPRLAASEPLALFARSPDGGVIAHAFQHEVQLHEAATGALIGAPLRGDSDAVDCIVQLAFAPDGNTLVARTVEGRWLHWNVAPDGRPLPELARLKGELEHAHEASRALHVPAAAERAALRAADPGPWPPAPERPPPKLADNALALPVPARGADASPLSLDLGPYYNMAPDAVHNPYYSVRPMMRPVPAGIQRVGGVDYDLRGIVQIGVYATDRNSTHLECVPAPAAPIAALWLLVQPSVQSPLSTEAPVIRITVHYRDGGSAATSVNAQRDVPGFAGRDQNVRPVFTPDPALVARGLNAPSISNPRIALPEPGRPIRCLDFDATQAAVPTALLAVTAEPVIAGAASGKRP